MKQALQIIIFLALISVSSLVSKVEAATECQVVYGLQTCKPPTTILINKTVQNPATANSYVENLGINDPKYLPDQVVNFQITVTNPSSTTINRIIVKDTFPQFVSFLSGAGNYDVKTNLLTFDIVNLKSQEARTYTVSGKAASQSALPVDQGIVCVTNLAIATNASDPNQVVQDSAQFCIQKQQISAQPTETPTPTQVPGGKKVLQPKVVGTITPTPTEVPVIAQVVPLTTKGGLVVYQAPKAKQTPATGSETLTLLALIPTGALGLYLRFKTKLG